MSLTVTVINQNNKKNHHHEFPFKYNYISRRKHIELNIKL